MKRGRSLLTTVVVVLVAVWGRPLGASAITDPEKSTEGDVATVVDGSTEFALDLYARLRTEHGNLFLSPRSISTALAMTYAGARGETARQMATVLRLSTEQERLHPAFAALESSLDAAGNDAGCRLHAANALWGQQGAHFLDEFLAPTRKYYGAVLREVDFVQAADQARKTINAWVADQTRKKITELLRRGDLDPSTVLVLTNAVYFQGNWASRFDRGYTREAPFRINPQDQVVVPMMQQVRRFPFAQTDELDLLEMPYAGDRLSMVLLLPKKLGGLAALEDSLRRENLERWLGRLRQQPVRVSLPRFQLDARFDLSGTLAALGMPDAFSGRKADFSGMTGRRDLWIDAVIHQARVEVNEEGTEADAATAVVIKKGPPVPEFTADHPFLFLIRDRQTGSILFLGRVVNPTS